MRSMDVSDRCVSTRSLCELPACCHSAKEASRPLAPRQCRAALHNTTAQHEQA
jgi:hypothetical protein